MAMPRMVMTDRSEDMAKKFRPYERERDTFRRCGSRGTIMPEWEIDSETTPACEDTMTSAHLKNATGVLVLLIVMLTTTLTASSFVAWLRLATMNDEPAKIGQVRIAQMQRVADVRLGVTEAASSLRLAMLASTADELENAAASIAATRNRVDRTMSMWQLDIVTPSGQHRYAQIEKIMAQLWQDVNSDLTHLQAGRKDEALASLMLETTPLLGKLYGALEHEQERQGQLLSRSIASIEEIAWTVRNHLLIWIAAIFAGLLAGSWYLVRALTRRQLRRSDT